MFISSLNQWNYNQNMWLFTGFGGAKRYLLSELTEGSGQLQDNILRIASCFYLIHAVMNSPSIQDKDNGWKRTLWKSIAKIITNFAHSRGNTSSTTSTTDLLQLQILLWYSVSLILHYYICIKNKINDNIDNKKWKSTWRKLKNVWLTSTK